MIQDERMIKLSTAPRKKVSIGALSAFAMLALTGCQATSHPTLPSQLGTARSTARMHELVDVPGPIELTTVVGANWEVTRGGLVNLDHPKAKQAGLVDGPEGIVIAFHAVSHPKAGLYLVDTGVEKAMRDAPSESALGTGLVAGEMHAEKIKVLQDTAGWIAAQKVAVSGVFLTHLHVDHVTGLRDVPASAVVYTGPGDAQSKGFLHLFTKAIINASLEGKGPIQEWKLEPDPSGSFEGIADVFGDGSFWAISVPGHTPGSTAYLARTPKGPVLLTGDASHTVWGWDNEVEPGSFSDDRPKSAESLHRLKNFANKHPTLEVRVGHQLRH
jgi:N-acyl homoserine lactone hydrolase